MVAITRRVPKIGHCDPVNTNCYFMSELHVFNGQGLRSAALHWAIHFVVMDSISRQANVKWLFQSVSPINFASLS